MMAALVRELRDCLDDIEHVIEAVKARAADDPVPWSISPYAMLDTNGRPMLADLLVAKAHVLTTLAVLEPAADVARLDNNWP